jgi:hypothetical protein
VTKVLQSFRVAPPGNGNGDGPRVEAAPECAHKIETWREKKECALSVRAAVGKQRSERTSGAVEISEVER